MYQGYLSGPTLQDNGVANAGFYDQELSLKWVQKYISKFGGDPHRVTIMGESAGGGSVMHQITAYGGLKGKAPFQQAIAQSPGQFPVTSNAAQENNLLLTFRYASLASGMNISTVQQLRNLSTKDLYNTNYLAVTLAPYATFVYGPAVDGKFVPALPAELLAHGQFDKTLKVMVGHNLNEGAYFANPFINSESDFVAVMKTNFPTASQSAINYITETMYPPVFDGSYGYTTQFQRIDLLTSELAFTCTTRWLDLAFKNRTYGKSHSIPFHLANQSQRLPSLLLHHAPRITRCRRPLHLLQRRHHYSRSRLSRQRYCGLRPAGLHYQLRHDKLAQHSRPTILPHLR